MLKKHFTNKTTLNFKIGAFFYCLSYCVFDFGVIVSTVFACPVGEYDTTKSFGFVGCKDPTKYCCLSADDAWWIHLIHLLLGWWRRR